MFNLESDTTVGILESYGFTPESIDVEKWYPNQMFLDIERKIYDSHGGTNALTAIGKSAVDNYIAPDGVTTLEDALLALPSVYTTNQRHLPDGYGWIIEEKGENHYQFTNNTGTTNHGAYGYVWALCQHMSSSDQNVRVIPLQGFELDSTEPAIFDITW